MPTITVVPENRQVPCAEGETLLNALLDAGLFVDNPCNGKATCGKCRVRIVSQNAPEPTEADRKFISEEDLEAGVRLSCLVRPDADYTVELMQKERKHEVLTSGYMPDFDFCPDVSKQLVTVHKATLADQTPFEEQICAQLGVASIASSVLSDGTGLPGEYTAVLHDGRVIGLEPGDTRDLQYGVAIDIGTTTVVCAVIDLLTGEELGSASQVNAQKSYGLDVLTRISYELEHPEDGVQKLQTAIVDSINAMIGEACEKSGVCRSNIYEIVVSANCTMMHMLLGVNARSIGKAPFSPVFSQSKDLLASEIGLQAAHGARLYCLPQVSAYIGADIVAGAYACQLKERGEKTLFIDIGTNGEIVLANEGKLTSCSCAAGPALEGMNISCGMRAAEGAIEEVKINGSDVELTVIGGRKPEGICGSGILAVLRELIATGIIRKTGAYIKKDRLAEDDPRNPLIGVLEDGKRYFIMHQGRNPLIISQGDVRQVQLAKGAILSGFVALLRNENMDMDDLDEVVVSGQFGAHLAPESLTGTGILPAEVQDKIVYVGNTSKAGAYMALMSHQAKREMEALAKEMGYLELGATDGYERLFSECMNFPAPSKSAK